MRKKNLSTIFKLALFFFIPLVYSQTPTIGLRYYDNAVSDGYTLFTPEVNQKVYLVNNCGEKINEWTFTELPGATCYLLENGTLLRAGKDLLEIRDWDNNVLWNYEMTLNGYNQHHDIEPLPNGNILCVLTDSYSSAEMIASGKDPLTVGLTMKLDKIIELKPIGTNDAEVVWEWKFMDHFIQDFDNTKLNYGNIIDHPELIDINYVDADVPNQSTDYTHVNAIDYHATLDQIMISARHLNEIYIIDHSTTTIEASGHTGGNSNLGGDILWRWGNPRVYKQGDITDQKLFLQHDSKWVESGYLDEGKITVFNNGGDGTNTFSSVHLIVPEIINNTYTKETSKFKPINFEWSWNGSIMGNTVKEVKKSGCHSLPNGNVIICETSLGQISEITKTGDVLWTYRNPTGQNISNQFDDLILYFNSIFRGEKYPPNYIGFTGKDVTPKGIIENENSISNNCNILSTIETAFETLKITNPVRHGILKFNKKVTFESIVIMDINGKQVYKTTHFSDDALNLNLKPGFYFIKLAKSGYFKTEKIIFN
ncbi:MAG: aryl-sulfate sulfotransferase [Flavobacteriaceae bacterium]|nr:aryl-sulfate sulfotransferase [Flavobacteriaceae bacterium]